MGHAAIINNTPAVVFFFLGPQKRKGPLRWLRENKIALLLVLPRWEERKRRGDGRSFLNKVRPLDRPRSSGRLRRHRLDAIARLVGLVIGSRASAGAFCRALLTAESTRQSRWLPARLRACSQARPRNAESAGRSGRRAMPQHARRQAEVGTAPRQCRNSLGVGRVARRARPDTKPYSRPLPRLTLKAGHKEGLPTTPIAVCGATSTGFRADPFFMRKHTGVFMCIEYIRIYYSAR